MKIIFLKDVARVGQRWQVKDLAPGYANLLISKGFADRATPNIIAKLEIKKKEEEQKKEMNKENFRLFLEKVNNLEIIIKARANEKGHLFKSVNKEEVLTELYLKTHINISDSFIDIGHIKSIGEHTIKFNDGTNKGECKIAVIPI